MIPFTCTHCQARLNVSDDKAGKSGKCPKCGRPIQVPSATAAAAGHTPLMPPAQARARAEDGEIPLAEEPRDRAAGPAWRQQPSRSAAGPVITPVHAGEGIERAEIPLAVEPAKKGKPTPPVHEPTPTAGGLVITPAGDAMVVSFQAPKILDAMTIETIGQELYALVDERACRKMVLDFSNVKFLSSQMLGVLVTLQKKVAGVKGRLLLCGVDSNLQQLFHIVKLERLLPIVADRPAALGVLSRP